MAAGVLICSATSMLSAWVLASLFSLDSMLGLSLLPRSFSTPFAMTVSKDIGGVPDLTALFVIITGVLGATIGETMLGILRLKSPVARGALLGMAAHGAGVAKARQIGNAEGSVTGLTMVLVGVPTSWSRRSWACGFRQQAVMHTATAPHSRMTYSFRVVSSTSHVPLKPGRRMWLSPALR
jgi:putative effector of murein hydrolase